MLNILVVCSGNICRSPMAEGILRSLIAEVGIPRIAVRSAGTLGIVDSPPAENAVTACRERDVDINEIRSSALNQGLLAWADIVLGMEPHHLEACQTLSDGKPPALALLGSYGDPALSEIDDPVGQDMETFRRCRDILFDCASGFVQRELKTMVPTARRGDTATGARDP